MRSSWWSLPPVTGAWRRLVRELSAFGVVGAICFALDLVLFQLLYASAGVPPVLAKALATLVTSTVAFAGHRLVTYRRRPRASVRRGYPLFAAINAATLLLGLGIIAFVRYVLGQEGALVLQIANVASIVIGTALRFVSYRRWVFPEAAPGAAPARREARTP
ncbi:GtrA family protein [Blastococcus sp. TF02A-26]|uniref:GtrA family protein n=1 Tax=Blastococcus sp. TF02A-26 TaxID=2250577 RepID=UPI000DEAD462|nr:GtrA family protein [Blastococcus sp. TF02A-26]RBY84425.1 GtrA family protein [Blastococcus sp. TF02A-26]